MERDTGVASSVVSGLVMPSEVSQVHVVGFVVEQLITGSEDERVARQRARRRRTAREERQLPRERASRLPRTSTPGP